MRFAGSMKTWLEEGSILARVGRRDGGDEDAMTVSLCLFSVDQNFKALDILVDMQLFW